MDIDFVNSHREALGRSKFETLTPDELQHHLKLIEQHAPYGNDPWDRVATLEFLWDNELDCCVACVQTPYGSARFPVPAAKGSRTVTPAAGKTFAEFAAR